MFDERLKNLRIARDFSQQKVAEDLGLKVNTYRNYENNEREPSSMTLLKIARYFGVTLDYLLDYHSVVNSAAVSKAVDISESEKKHLSKYRVLDDFGREAVDSILEVEHKRCMSKLAEETSKPRTITISRSLLTASAGAGEYLSEGNYEPREYPDTPQARQADVVIPVSGRSMEPMFFDGDELYVRVQPSINIGEIGIFIKDEQGYVKKAGEDRLISLNPDYEDIFTDGEPIVCFGKVLGKVERGE